MHALQASVLSLFHGGRAVLTPADVAKTLGLSAELTVYLLLSLLYPPKAPALKKARTQALLQSSGSTKVKATDKIRANPKFGSLLLAFRWTPLDADRVEQFAGGPRAGGGGRGNAGDHKMMNRLMLAAVRTMKARRVLGMRELQAVMIEQVSRMGRPEKRQVRDAIKTCIEQDFFKRSEADPSKLEYIK
jgi:hypothetical protein